MGLDLVLIRGSAVTSWRPDEAAQAAPPFISPEPVTSTRFTTPHPYLDALC
jgi:hypothetical protein